MSLAIPLAVRLATSRGDQYVTRQLRDLIFRTTAVGGFASASLALDRPLTIQPAEIAYYGKVFVHDARNGRVVWEGRLEDPGRSAGSDGPVWDLKAMGPAAHGFDRQVPLIYVDRRLDPWITPGYSINHAEISRRDSSTVQMSVTRGEVLANGAEMAIDYKAIADAGQLVGRISASWDSGVTDTDLSLRIYSIPSGTVDDSDAANVAGGTLSASRGGSPALTAGTNQVDLLVRRLISGLTVANDDTWCQFSSIAVRAQLKTKAGADITSGYSTDTVLASEVVADLLGRLLAKFDGAGAAIATTTYAIDQLAYPDGATPGQILADLLKLEPGFRWGAWESNAAGLHRFEFSPWPSTVRYEADILDGYDSTGSGGGLYNAVTVRYKQANGQIGTVRRTSTVAELTAAGLTREAFLDLGDEIGSSAAATQAGDQFLIQHGSAPNAGRLIIARPVLDLVTGQKVMPWEILPGNLIRVRGILPRVNALNASARDGVTVFRIVSNTYHAAQAHAELELDSFAPSTARSLADLQSRPNNRRR